MADRFTIIDGQVFKLVPVSDAEWATKRGTADAPLTVEQLSAFLVLNGQCTLR